jgi:hypothetical protein
MLKITVQYDRHVDRWSVIRAKMKSDRTPTTLSQHTDKDDAVKRGRVEAKALHVATGETVELIIKNLDGTIGKGSSSRSTYGPDPKRRKG